MRPPKPSVTPMLVSVVAFLLALAAPVARAEPPPPLPPPSPEQTTRLLAIVSSVGQFKLLDSSPQGYQLGLLGDDGRTIGILSLETGPSDTPLRFHSRSFGMRIGNFAPDLAIVETLVKAAHLIAEHDDGSWARDNIPPPNAPQVRWWNDPRNYPDPLLTDVTTGFIIAAILLGLWRRGKVSWEIRLPHLIPASIQVLLFTYWGMYWASVGAHVPTILMQVVLGFAIDATFAFLKFGSWRIGASPLPIVLSSNLFAWFNTPGILINLIGAFASKTFVHWKGKHILNPSATGLTMAGLTALFFPQFVSFGGVFHVMNLAPNMTEIVVLLALWPQSRFRIVPVSIGAVVALQYQGIPGVLRPSMLLAVALLATDPATMPKTDLGKILFGLFLGFAFPATSLQLRAMGSPDDFSKVIAIPVANAFAPFFDLVGQHLWNVGALVVARIRSAWKSFPERLAALGGWRIPDWGMIALWLVLVLPGLGREKPSLFEPTLHWMLGTPLVIRDADDVPRCEHNPLFCKPFSFVEEVRLWVHPPADSGPAVPTPRPAAIPIVGGPQPGG